MKRILLILACCVTATVGFAQAPNSPPAPNSTAGGSYSLWSTSTVPVTAAFGDPNAYEIGVKFYSDSGGFITAIRFYKGAGNSGTHIAHLWSSTGTLLSTATFTNETASGWQQVTLPNPVPITAGTVYVASYWDPNGHYSLNRPYFTAQYNNPPLHALANGADGANGVYLYNSNAFPTGAYQSSNYWVDVVFTAGVSSNGSGTPTGSVPPPAVSSISPTLGPVSGGTLVTINGSNFASGATVSFGSVGATSVNFISPTQLEAVAPPESAGTVSVAVTNSGGESASLANAFIYSSGPAITSVSPDSGSATGGTTVTITGSGFESGAMVAFGVTPATSVTVISPTEIQAVTPAESAGTAGVTVTNPDSGLGTLASGFAFLAVGLGSGVGPAVASVSPNSNISTGGATVTINGENFVPGAIVQFGLTPAASVTFVSSKQLQAVVPPGIPETTVNLTVTNPGGLSSTLTNGFFYGTILFQNGFENGNFSAWNTYSNPSNVTITSTIVHSGSYAAQIFYSLPANPQGANRDSNNWFQHLFPIPVTHFFVRGYVYLQTPMVGNGEDTGRKLLYFKQNQDSVAGGTDPGNWAFTLSCASDAGTGDRQLNVSAFPPQDSLYQSSDGSISWDLFNLQQSTWYSLELEAQLNTPGVRNGYINVWVNGSQVLNRTSMNLRGDSSSGLTDVEIGDQLDTASTGAIQEYRYWDDIVIADAFISP